MKQHSTNYYNTLITVAEDCKTKEAIAPPAKEGKLTVANLQYDMLMENSGDMTSDDLIFNVHAIRKDFIEQELETERANFYSKGQACLRTSPLAKTYGWAIYHDAEGKIKLLDPNTDEYRRLMEDDGINKVPAMKSSK